MLGASFLDDWPRAKRREFIALAAGIDEKMRWGWCRSRWPVEIGRVGHLSRSNEKERRKGEKKCIERNDEAEAGNVEVDEK